MPAAVPHRADRIAPARTFGERDGNGLLPLRIVIETVALEERQRLPRPLSPALSPARLLADDDEPFGRVGSVDERTVGGLDGGEVGGLPPPLRHVRAPQPLGEQGKVRPVQGSEEEPDEAEALGPRLIGTRVDHDAGIASAGGRFRCGPCGGRPRTLPLWPGWRPSKCPSVPLVGVTPRTAVRSPLGRTCPE